MRTYQPAENSAGGTARPVVAQAEPEGIARSTRLCRAPGKGNAFLDERQHNLELGYRSWAVDHELRAEILVLMRLGPAELRKLSTARSRKTKMQIRVGDSVQMHWFKTLSWCK